MESRRINVGLKGVKARVFSHSFEGVPVKTLVVSFQRPRRVLSTREGFKQVKAVGNNCNPPALWDLVHKRWGEYLEKVSSDMGYKQEEIALLSTGADLDNLARAKEKFKGWEVCCLATAGVCSNAMRVGEDKAGSYEENGNFFPLGTVNIILLTNASLSDGALARALITITEAKAQALQDLDVRSSYTPLINQATGTGTDNVIVVSGTGSEIHYVGGHAKMGELIAKTTSMAVKEAIRKQNGLFPSRPMEQRLKERGITIDELVRTGLERCVPDSQIERRDKIGLLLKRELTRALKDKNVSCLLLAGLRLAEEQQRRAIPGFGAKDNDKSNSLVANEMLAAQIAVYLSGTKALSKFRDFLKKGVNLSQKFPQLVDNLLGGLICGCLVKICSR